MCREKADTPRHVLLRCPALMERRLRRFGTICPDPPEAPLHEGRAPEQDVARGVCLLAAHGAPAS